MSNEIKLVHISDLHFSVNQHCQANYLAHSMPHLEDMTDKMNSFNFDRLIISGDISNQGDKDSLKLAHDWIFYEIPTADNSSVGLKLKPNQVIPVPGNHDARNNLKERSIWLRNLRQKSIGNYNDVFEHHSYDPDQNYCRYDWLDEGDWGIWIVSVDTLSLIHI